MVLVVFEHLFKRGWEEQLPGSAGHEEEGDEFEAASTFTELVSPLSESGLFFLKLLLKNVSVVIIAIDLGVLNIVVVDVLGVTINGRDCCSPVGDRHVIVELRSISLTVKWFGRCLHFGVEQAAIVLTFVAHSTN